MNTIWIGNYNNYYNRIHKTVYPNMYAYTQNGFTKSHYFNDINFNRADSINTKLTINLKPTDTDFNDHINPDYLTVCTNEEYNPVLSRWFVLEAEWNRDHQLILTLRRDLISDFWASFKDNDFYCEKGAIPSGFDWTDGGTPATVYVSNVPKFNTEAMTFNSILKSRTPLKQFSGQSSRFIIGYVDRSWKGGKVSTEAVDYYFDNWDSCPLKSYYDYPDSLIYPGTIGKQVVCTVVKGISGTSQPTSGTVGRLNFLVSSQGGSTISTLSDISGASGIGSPSFTLPFSDYTQAFFNAVSDKLTGDNGIENCEAYDRAIVDSRKIVVDSELISQYNNKVIAIGTNYYKVTFGTGSYKYINGIQLPGEACSVVANAIGSQVADLWTIPEFNKYVSGRLSYRKATVSFAEVGSVTISTRDHPGNLPYDIFVIEESTDSRAFASNLATQFAGGNVVYDIQLLPFRPSDSNLTDSGITIGTKKLYWAKADHVEGSFYHSAIKSYSTDTEYKIGSNMHLCRIYSPDGASCWEFNPAKIGGVGANSIKYEVTFAPIRPYIHIFPTFGGIYGRVNKTSFTAPYEGESRGLMCTGDYSIPYATNNWATYQINNSAYQLAHDRQIQNMSRHQTAEKIQEAVGIITGTIGGGMSGAQSGAMMGGGWGALAGGLVGTATSFGAGIASQAMNSWLRKEDISYVEDMFGYSLQNIQAQAQPLAHSNYLTIGVAYFPYIELYEATDAEEKIFVDRLRVNGWSLGLVTTLANMKTACTALGSPTKFCCGRLVKFGGDEDSHLVNELNAELQRGVRFE